MRLLYEVSQPSSIIFQLGEHVCRVFFLSSIFDKLIQVRRFDSNSRSLFEIKGHFSMVNSLKKGLTKPSACAFVSQVARSVSIAQRRTLTTSRCLNWKEVEILNCILGVQALQ